MKQIFNKAYYERIRDDKRKKEKEKSDLLRAEIKGKTIKWVEYDKEIKQI